MAYVDQGMTGSKATSLIISIAIVAGIGLAMVIGLAVDAVKKEIERVTTVDVTEEEPPEPEEEPPEPEDIPETAPPPPVAPPPPLNIAPNPPEVQTQTEIPPATPPAPINPPPAPPGPPPAPPPPPPPPSQAKSATTKNERRWASRISNDYPSRALREEVEGTVGVRVTVNEKGRASACTVTSSSGSDVLDKAACRGMRRYSRFNPALNDAGEPTTGSYSTRITYRLN